jgi:hypothetical protein
MNLIVVLEGEGMKPSDIIPSRCKVQFLHGVVLWSNVNTWAINIVGPKNFASKYYAGRARPEETAWSVHCSLEANKFKQECDGAIMLSLLDIPEYIQNHIAEMELTHMEDFGAYDEGAPMHPSWPAMHSAASCMSVWLPIVVDLTEEQLEEVKKTDLAVSMARTVAGVHYIDDNIAGLAMGQKIIQDTLPGFLQAKYNADPDAVRARLIANHFSWADTANRLLGDYAMRDNVAPGL